MYASTRLQEAKQTNRDSFGNRPDCAQLFSELQGPRPGPKEAGPVEIYVQVF